MTNHLLEPRDLDFILNDLLGVERMLAYPRFADHDRGTFAAVLEIAEAIATEKFRPHNRAADLAEPRIENGRVVLVDGVKEALDAFNEAGFVAAHHDAEIGGMQLPWTVVQASLAWFKAANVGSAAYAFLTIAAANLLRAHGNEEQQRRYMMPMLEGRFFGTMVLSEPHAGSSLSDVRTTARRGDDGLYRITGSKMWISGGEHELSENIVHLVLARIEGAPAGVRGLSLFIVPRYRLDDGGWPGPSNGVVLAGLNHKMGYRGTVNTVLSLGEDEPCLGELIGEPNKGLACMFHMMNEARIGVGLGAVVLGYTGYLHSLDYARTRPQGRHPGDKDPTSPQVMLIEHADIRRMLLAQKAIVEGGLAFGLKLASLIDTEKNDPDADVRARSGLLLDLLTPIMKSWFSDRALEANSLAIQIHGGAGYTRDYPVEQFYRDNRLNPIHEGTNGIQAIDLLGRKATMKDGAALSLFLEALEETAAAADAIEDLAAHAADLRTAGGRLREVTAMLVVAGAEHGARRMLADASVYMDLAGHVAFAWTWLEQAIAAHRALAVADGDDRRAFLEGKLAAARWVFRRELPNTARLADLLATLDDTAFGMAEASF